MDNFDNRGRKVCCKVSLYNNSQRQRCTAINCLSTGINILAVTWAEFDVICIV